tara:strand:+ start:854 stop:1144 length:291 start_codon:yes stop_codon:yes gene_type:complete
MKSHLPAFGSWVKPRNIVVFENFVDERGPYFMAHAQKERTIQTLTGRKCLAPSVEMERYGAVRVFVGSHCERAKCPQGIVSKSFFHSLDKGIPQGV